MTRRAERRIRRFVIDYIPARALERLDGRGGRRRQTVRAHTVGEAVGRWQLRHPGARRLGVREP